jgi:hypothetical protein
LTDNRKYVDFSSLPLVVRGKNSIANKPEKMIQFQSFCTDIDIRADCDILIAWVANPPPM